MRPGSGRTLARAVHRRDGEPIATDVREPERTGPRRVGAVMLWPSVSIAGFLVTMGVVVALARSRTAEWERERRQVREARREAAREAARTAVRRRPRRIRRGRRREAVASSAGVPRRRPPLPGRRRSRD